MQAKSYTRETIRNIGVSPRNFPDFQVGDTIAVSQRIKEGGKERIQVFQGDVIAIHKNGASSTFTVRKIGANSVPVERIFPFQTPIIESIKLIRKGKVRRAKLYYLRDRIGKKARVAEDINARKKRATVVEVEETASETKQESEETPSENTENK